VPELIGFDGQVLAFSTDNTGPGTSDLLGYWSPDYQKDTRNQVVRAKAGQPVKVVLRPFDTYPVVSDVTRFYLETDTEDGSERICQVSPDNMIEYVLPVRDTAALGPGTVRWEVWADDGPRPLAVGILVLSGTVKP
jgi:hypothetical protein